MPDSFMPFETGSIMSRTCAYCGNKAAATRDHVIPRELYRVSERSDRIQLLTVDACRECNGSFSADETEFCTFISLGKRRSIAANELAFGGRALRKMTRARNMAFRRRVESSFCEMDILTSSGLWVGQEMALRIPDSFRRTLFKITRGLYFHHVGFVVPGTCTFRLHDFADLSVAKEDVPSIVEGRRRLGSGYPTFF